MKLYPNFISFEGIDFCGKTTQIKLLIERLERLEQSVHVVREPGGTAISEKIREILLNVAHAEMHPKTEILLYSAARAQLVHQEIIPLLEQKRLVIADRFFDSTTAYQGYGRGLDLQFINQLNRFAASELVPCRTFLIDVTPETALERRKASGRSDDRLEREHISFYQTIREGFLKLAAQHPQRFLVIPGEDSIEAIHEQVWSQLQKIWPIGS